MWSILICLYFGALRYTVASSPPSPVNVVFSSVNLKNVLQWYPGNNTPASTLFTVQYAIYGDNVVGSKGKRVNWRVVRHCMDILRSWCDLTNETQDLEQGYYARVRATGRRAYSKWEMTQSRFDPISDTTLGPPLVSVEIEANTATITIKGPMRYQPNNITPVVSMETFYHKMTYNLSIHNTHKDQTRHILMDSSTYKYRLMEYATEYCFSVRTRLFSMPIHCQASEWHCITTPTDPLIGQLQEVIVGIVVPSVCICVLVVVGYLLFHYLTGKGKNSPDALNPLEFHLSPLTFSPEKTNLIFTSVIKNQPTLSAKSSESTCPEQQRQIPDFPPPYNPQRQPAEPEEPWDNMSTDYGFVHLGPQASVGEEGQNGERKEDVLRSGYEMKEWTIEAHLAPGAAFHAKSSDPQTSAHRQTDATAHMQMSQVDPVFVPRSQASVTAFQGEMAMGKGDQECPAINIKKDPNTGLFQILSERQAKREGVEGATEKEVVGEVNEIFDAGAARNTECERAPLLSGYASQHISSFRADQSEGLPDDYGVLRLATEQEMGKGEEEEEEQEMDEGSICFTWDPEARKLTRAQMEESQRGGGLKELGETEREEEVEMKPIENSLRLENVFVRQASEETREAGGEVDEIMTKWNLVISMDQ